MRSFTCIALLASLALLTISPTFTATLSEQQQGVYLGIEKSIPLKSSINKWEYREPYHCKDSEEATKCCQGCTEQSRVDYELSVKACYNSCDPNYQGEGGGTDSGVGIDLDLSYQD